MLRALDTDAESGLSEAETARRLREVGRNELEDRGSRSPWAILWEQFTSTMLAILIVAALASALLGDYEDSILIAVIVVLNAALGFGHQRVVLADRQRDKRTVGVRDAHRLGLGPASLSDGAGIVSRPPAASTHSVYLRGIG